MQSSSSITQSVLAISLPAAQSEHSKELPKTVRVALAKIDEKESSGDIKRLFLEAKGVVLADEETMSSQSRKIAEFMQKRTKEHNADPKKSHASNLEALETFFHQRFTVVDLASMEIKPEIAFEQCTAIKGALGRNLQQHRGELNFNLEHGGKYTRPTKEFIPLLAIACKEYPRAFNVAIAGASLTEQDIISFTNELLGATGVLDLSKCQYKGSLHELNELKKIGTEDLLIMLPSASSK